jgi:hypothetical protein
MKLGIQDMVHFETDNQTPHCSLVIDVLPHGDADHTPYDIGYIVQAAV